MEGYWLSVIEDTPRRYSLGELRFSFRSKQHRYDGITYSNDGDRKFSWETIRAFFDQEHTQFLYIYEVTHLDGSGLKTHGFGQVTIPNRGIPVGRGDTGGYFVDAEKANSNVHQTRLFLAGKVAEELFISLDPKNEESRKNFIKQLAAINWP
jgi:hypothetical protein